MPSSPAATCGHATTNTRAGQGKAGYSQFLVGGVEWSPSASCPNAGACVGEGPTTLRPGRFDAAHRIELLISIF